MDEDLKNWNFVLEGFEKWVETQVIAEVNPLLPVSDARGGSSRSDYLGECFRRNTEIIA